MHNTIYSVSPLSHATLQYNETCHLRTNIFFWNYFMSFYIPQYNRYFSIPKSWFLSLVTRVKLCQRQRWFWYVFLYLWPHRLFTLRFCDFPICRVKFLVINYKCLDYLPLTLRKQDAIQHSSFTQFILHLGSVPQIKLQYDINIR
jgi:hypothetical protein